MYSTATLPVQERFKFKNLNRKRIASTMWMTTSRLSLLPYHKTEHCNERATIKEDLRVLHAAGKILKTNPPRPRRAARNPEWARACKNRPRCRRIVREDHPKRLAQQIWPRVSWIMQQKRPHAAITRVQKFQRDPEEHTYEPWLAAL